jgi:heat shock protein 1/8
MTEYAIGIDLGTTYSCVAVWQNGKVEIIANEQGNRTTPSFVAFTDEETLCGDSAKNQCALNPDNTIYDAKRLIGRNFEDSTVQQDMKHFSFKVVRSDEGKPLISAKSKGEMKNYTPEEISARVLSEMKKTAETYLGTTVKKAVITVPAYFNDSQRQSTKDAGTIAGLEVLRVINEPTAASLAYGLGQEDAEKEKEKKVLIFDLGGGTFDVSVLVIEDGMFEVKATSGDTHLGGEDFDNRIVDYCLNEFKKKNKNIDYDFSARTLRRLRTSCEKAKRTLSSTMSTIVEVDSLHQGIDFTCTLTRAKFEDLCADLFRGCLKPVEESLRESKFDKNQIDEVILVGGSTRIPYVQKLLTEFFNGKKLNQSVNPDEAVAYGAAVQARILSGGRDEQLGGVVLVDVVPLNLSVETQGEFATPIIKKGSTIPCRKTETFSTGVNNQPMAKINVFEGMRARTKDNNLLGTFTLDNIPPMPRGVPQIEITYDVDANGILNVSAVEKSSGKRSDLTIKNDKGRLSKEDIERMVEEAELNREEDERYRQRGDAKSRLESFIYESKETLNKDKENANFETVSNKLKELETWMDDSSRTESTKEDFETKLKTYEEELSPLLKDFKNSDPKPESSSGMPDMASMMNAMKDKDGNLPDMSKLAGMMGGNGGMPDMSKLAGMMGQNGLPDMSKLAGMGGMPDMSKLAGMMGGNGMPNLKDFSPEKLEQMSEMFSQFQNKNSDAAQEMDEEVETAQPKVDLLD